MWTARGPKLQSRHLNVFSVALFWSCGQVCTSPRTGPLPQPDPPLLVLRGGCAVFQGFQLQLCPPKEQTLGHTLPLRVCFLSSRRCDCSRCRHTPADFDLVSGCTLSPGRVGLARAAAGSLPLLRELHVYTGCHQPSDCSVDVPWVQSVRTYPFLALC